MDSSSSSSIRALLFGEGHDDASAIQIGPIPTVDNIPMNEPSIRRWQLNENSTHYDRMVAAPTDADLLKFWSGWAGIMLMTGVLTTLILIPLLASYKIRAKAFHWYLIFLMIPDMLVAWICGFTCLSNAIAGHFTSVFMCKFQSFYMIASIGANSWINLLVTRQLYLMLKAASSLTPTTEYIKPTRRSVIQECLAVYVYALFLATLGIVGNDSPWWPHKTRLTIGAACIPMDYDTASTIFFYCVFFPLLFGIPLAYVCWAAYSIWKHQMLPPTGRRRLLAIYFFRLAAVFLIMWLPGLLLLFVTAAWLDPWVQWAGGVWSHLQGMVSALVSLLKPDVWEAVAEFWSCCGSAGCLDVEYYKGGFAGSASRGDPSSTNYHRRGGANPNHPVVISKQSLWSQIADKKPHWVTANVYWSPLITAMGRTPPAQTCRNKPLPEKSRVSSYQEYDDEFEMAAAMAAAHRNGHHHNNNNGNVELRISSLDTRSNLLVSDESILVLDHTTTDEMEQSNNDNDNHNHNHSNVDDHARRPQSVLGGGQQPLPPKEQDAEQGHFQKRYKGPPTTTASYSKHTNMDDTMDSHTDVFTKDETTPTCTSHNSNGGTPNKQYAPFGTIYIVPKKIHPTAAEETTTCTNTSTTTMGQDHKEEEGKQQQQGSGDGEPTTSARSNNFNPSYLPPPPPPAAAVPEKRIDPFSLSDDDDSDSDSNSDSDDSSVDNTSVPAAVPAPAEKRIDPFSLSDDSDSDDSTFDNHPKCVPTPAVSASASPARTDPFSLSDDSESDDDDKDGNRS